jgi:hypothetical protein
MVPCLLILVVVAGSPDAFFADPEGAVVPLQETELVVTQTQEDSSKSSPQDKACAELGVERTGPRFGQFSMQRDSSHPGGESFGIADCCVYLRTDSQLWLQFFAVRGKTGFSTRFEQGQMRSISF